MTSTPSFFPVASSSSFFGCHFTGFLRYHGQGGNTACTQCVLSPALICVMDPSINPGKGSCVLRGFMHAARSIRIKTISVRNDCHQSGQCCPHSHYLESPLPAAHHEADHPRKDPKCNQANCSATHTGEACIKVTHNASRACKCCTSYVQESLCQYLAFEVHRRPHHSCSAL